MYTRLTTWFAAAALIIAILTASSVALAGLRPIQLVANKAPEMVSYQGKVMLGGTPFSGTGYFKFAVINAAATISYWSNDGTSAAGSEPAGSVTLPVTGGLFTVLLGDAAAGMQAIEADVFSAPDRALRVWFGSDGAHFTLLTPDQRIASVPFALQAENAQSADNADTLDGQHAGAFQLRVSGGCGIGSTIRAINADGTVACQADAPLNRTFPPQANTLSNLLYAGGSSQFYYISLTIGVDGLALISFYDTNSMTLKVAHCNDIPCTGVSVTTLDNSAAVGRFTSITIGPDGQAMISYRDGTNGDLKIAHCTDIPCTTASIVRIGSTMDEGYYTSITIGGDSLPLVSYYNATDQELRVAHCNMPDCSNRSVYTLDSSANVGWYTSITTGADGFGLISYLDASNGRLKVAHCTNAACSTYTAYIVDSTIGFSDEYDVGTSITRGADGLGLISYHDFNNKTLKVAHCNNVACSSASTYTLDNTYDVGFYSSITIGADGLGVISYDWQDVNDLRVAHCIDLQCSAAAIYNVDNGWSTGLFTAITIGVDGLPLIGYFDMDNGYLRAAHCGSPLCAPFLRRR